VTYPIVRISCRSGREGGTTAGTTVRSRGVCLLLSDTETYGNVAGSEHRVGPRAADRAVRGAHNTPSAVPFNFHCSPNHWQGCVPSSFIYTRLAQKSQRGTPGVTRRDRPNNMHIRPKLNTATSTSHCYENSNFKSSSLLSCRSFLLTDWLSEILTNSDLRCCTCSIFSSIEFLTTYLMDVTLRV
jgi:hypothetical protein